MSNNLKSWKNSIAKKLLEEDLRSGKIPLDGNAMKPKEVYEERPEFAEFCEYKHFPRRLRELHQQISRKNDRALTAADAVAHDRKIYSEEDSKQTGKARWEGSEAERLLRLDMDAGKHEVMAPHLLYEERLEYREFPLDVFRGHIYQEQRSRKFRRQYGATRAKK
jgi:hypothetical protein